MTNTPSPCKTFNKKESITCYKLMYNHQTNKLDHYELYRINNRTPGEFYVLPIDTLQKQTNRHLSYHKSGAFHWRNQEDGNKVVPRDQEADERRASLLVQAMEHLSGRLLGYCISKGKNLSESQLESMVEIMDGYIIPPIIDIGVHKILLEKKSHSILLFDMPYIYQAQKIIIEARRNGDSKTITKKELFSILEKNNVDKSKIIQLEPGNGIEVYETFSVNVINKLIDIGRRMVEEKMENKPAAFWTNNPPNINSL
ncbi:MAG: hypothetical protein V1706_14875 [Pseudomonadota bacterium]